MPDIFQLIAAWKKQIFLTVLLAMIVASAIVFIMPPKYLASATAIASNPVTADKSIVFNNNIRDLYNSLGSASDLDMIVGTGQLDTIYIAVAKRFRLNSYYTVKDTTAAGWLKTAKALKKDARVTKSEFGGLLVRVWNKNKDLAPQLANALMSELASIHQHLLNKHNQEMRVHISMVEDSLRRTIGLLKSSRTGDPNINTSILQDLEPLEKQQELYSRLKSEYALMAVVNTPAIQIVEAARISDKPDSPRKTIILIATAIASFVFALWLAVLLDKRKRSGK